MRSNNAGIVHTPQPMFTRRSQWLSSPRLYSTGVIAVDLRGVFLCMKYEFQHMLRARKGTIVNIASVAGLLPEANDGAYVATKRVMSRPNTA